MSYPPITDVPTSAFSRVERPRPHIHIHIDIFLPLAELIRLLFSHAPLRPIFTTPAFRFRGIYRTILQSPSGASHLVGASTASASVRRLAGLAILAPRSPDCGKTAAPFHPRPFDMTDPTSPTVVEPRGEAGIPQYLNLTRLNVNQLPSHPDLSNSHDDSRISLGQFLNNLIAEISRVNLSEDP